MARLIQCGFEENTLTAGVEIDTIVTGGAAQTIQNTTARISGYALKFNPSAGKSIVRWTVYGSDQARAGYLRFYIYITTLPGGGGTALAYFYNSAASVAEAQLTLKADGTLTLGEANNAVLGSASPAMSLNTWYRIDLKNDATGTGVIEARLNGSVFATGANSSQGNWAKIDIGSISSATCTFYIDDIALNDDTGASETGYPEDGHIVHLRPAATGDSNGFLVNVGGTAGATNNFTRVNEFPPDNATTYNASVVLNASDLMKVDALASVGTVNVVCVGGTFADITTADVTSSLEFQCEKASGGTIAKSSAIIPNSTTWKTNVPAATSCAQYPLVLYNDPDGSPWTATTIGTMQVGYLISAAGVHTIGVTAAWASVDYQVQTNVTANAGLATVTVAAYGPAPSVDPSAGLATVSASAYGASPGVAPAAGLAQVAATAYGGVPSITVGAGLANVTVAAQAPKPAITIAAGLASVVIAAFGGVPSLTTPAGLASVTATAYAATSSIAAAAGLAAVTVAAFGAVPSVTVSAGLATVSVQAFGAIFHEADVYLVAVAVPLTLTAVSGVPTVTAGPVVTTILAVAGVPVVATSPVILTVDAT